MNKSKFLFVAATFVLLAVLPLMAGQYGVDLVTKIMVFAIFALSLELLVGSTGLVCFGQAAFFGIGAYATVLLTPQDGSVAPTVQANLCGLLARAAGSAGMAGGQAIDLASVGLPLTESQLREMHELKTGALLQASVVMGAQCGAPDPRALRALRAYGAAIGLAFQVVDDILDVTADSTTLGKTAGKDADNNKPTYVSLMGLQASQAYAQRLLAQARLALDDSGLPQTRTRALRALADMVVNRAS